MVGLEPSAVKLSQGPLGIIALFIVLVHGFASLVLGLGHDIGEANRTTLVWFLVLFPLVVFVVFAWLVTKYHVNLYPPQAFRNEHLFRELAFGRASFDKPASGDPPMKVPDSVANALKESATGSEPHYALKLRRRCTVVICMISTTGL